MSDWTSEISNLTLLIDRRLPRYSAEEYSYIANLRNSLDVDNNEIPDTLPEDVFPEDEKLIRLDTVEFYSRQNAAEHHTDKYEVVQSQPVSPVLRRGQPFYMSIRFANRDFNHETDTIKIIFDFGPRPVVATGTRVELAVGQNSEFDLGKAKWEVRLHHHDDKVIALEVNIPANVCVGLWKCRVVCGLKEDRSKTQTFKCKENIYIIFNPWCKEDAVFMETDAERQEYVLNDVGKVYVGNGDRPIGRHWIFAQFEDIVLPCCIYILALSKLDFASYGNVIKVTRAISAAINYQDEEGILVGRWNGKYEDGVAPWDWTGSLKIIEQYMKSDGKPVKYGQCWVFSGLATTICRALGIPCRSVTNIVSAHDNRKNLTIDKYFDRHGDYVEHESDFIWNFHVWNDVWMARFDLPVGYGGWQAIDATPQETSEGVYQAGPASITAIVRGEIGFQYDTLFIFSEVNGDVIHWHETDDGYEPQKVDKYEVGQGIYTKKVGVFDDDGNDDIMVITSIYKRTEGSEAERLAMFNAAREGGRGDFYQLPEDENNDVAFDLIEIDRITIGDPFSVKVQIKNESDERRTVTAILSTSSVYYTGVQANKIKKVEHTFTLEPRQQDLLEIDITDEEYLDKLVDYSLIKIYASAIVKETKQTWTEEDDFAVEKPKLELQIEGSVTVGTEFKLTATFTNPLKQSVKEGRFSFEGTGLSRPRTVPIREIMAGETYRHEERFTPNRSGERKIVANFSSNILKELNASKTIDVQQKA